MAEVPAPADVQSLLLFEGADGDTTFKDQKGFTWANTGTPRILQIGNANVGAFDGASYMTTTLAAAAALLPYTYEAIMVRGTLGTNQCIFDTRSSTLQGVGVYANLAANNLGLSNNSAIIATGTTNAILSSKKVHIAVCRDASLVTRGFVGGVQVFSVTDSRNLTSFAASLGRSFSSTQFFTGQVLASRYVVNEALYTSAFTPPTTLRRRFTASGEVNVGSPPVPSKRKVMIVAPTRSVVVGTAVSDATTGDYSTTLDVNDAETVYGIAYPDYGDPWKASSVYTLVSSTWKKPISGSGHWYQCEQAGTSGTTEPTWPTDGSQITDGTVKWRDKGVMERPWAEGPYLAQGP